MNIRSFSLFCGNIQKCTTPVDLKSRHIRIGSKQELVWCWLAWTCKSILDTIGCHNNSFDCLVPCLFGKSSVICESIRSLLHRVSSSKPETSSTNIRKYRCFSMDVMSTGPSISMWIFSHTDPAFLAVERSGRRPNFPRIYPLQVGPIDLVSVIQFWKFFDESFWKNRSGRSRARYLNRSY